MVAATAREEEEEGGRPDRELTGDSPVRLSWPENGRRWRIWRRRARFSGEESATPTTIRASGSNSFGGEIEDDEADLLSTLAGLGEARDTSASRRPWTAVRFHLRKRELNGRRRRSAREREGKERGWRRGVLGHLQEVDGEAGGGSGGLQGQPRSCSLSSTRKTTNILHKAPYFFGIF
jgi:hypothetical protein